MSKEKVLITGASGFTGYYVQRVLNEAGYEAIGTRELADNNGQISLDITDKDSVKKVLKTVKPDGIIHLAALSFVAGSNQKKFYDTNVFGVLNILEAVDELGLDLKKIVIASSANIYGCPDVEQVSEEYGYKPVNHYAASKVTMEYMAKLWFPKLPILITRPFNYTGVGQKSHFLIPKIIKHFAKNEPFIELGNLDVSREFSDVRDVAESYMRLYASDVDSTFVNICSGLPISLINVVDTVRELSGHDIEVRVNPDFVRANEIRTLCGDNTRLLQITGYKFQYSINDTLAGMLDEGSYKS